MTKAKLIKGAKWVGKWGEDNYIAHIPGEEAEDVSIKKLPNQPYENYHPASMQRQNSVKNRADEILRKIKENPAWYAQYKEQFEAYCAQNGRKYEKNGKTYTRRQIDYMRGDVMRRLYSGEWPMEGEIEFTPKPCDGDTKVV
ncbi:MAG: hypothetical protein IKN59_06370 [Paludibacteraceae bacterium]|nr:hypothetical protein [Paludibacteraceae bacterium]